MEEVLKQIVEALDISNENAGRRLWWILTALRGPDEENVLDLKEATTAVIRRRIGMRQWGNAGGAVVKDDCQHFVDIRKKMTEDVQKDRYRLSFSPHFYLHAVEAFKALGLKWEEINRF